MNIATFGRAPAGRKKIAIVGSGVSGAACAWALSGTADVTLYEAATRPGGHTATVEVEHGGLRAAVDTGFIVYNEANYPDLSALLAHLRVATHASDMSFALSLDGGRLEWSGQSYQAIFAQKRNVLSPSFLGMLREILRFNRLCVADRDAGRMAGLSIGAYLERERYSPAFRDNYLVPMAACIWSTPRIRMLDFPASNFVTFFENHRLIHAERPVWRTVTGGARTYLDRLLAPLGDRLRLGAPVATIIRDAFGATVWTRDGAAERYDTVVVAAHSDQALALLGDPSAAERNILSAIPYRPNRVVLHRDTSLMPRRRGVWSSWNFLRRSSDGDEAAVCVSYWMNRLQGIDPALPLFVTLNPIHEPREDQVFGEWTFDHPQFDAAGISAQTRLDEIQGLRNTWFAGAWTGYGFHEDGLRSGLDAAEALGARVPWRRAATALPQQPLAAE